MDDTPEGTAGAGKPALQAAHPPRPADAVLDRRRALLRAAASSAPLVVGLAPNAAGAAASAYRGALEDANATPAGQCTFGVEDTWIRKPISVHVGEIWFKPNSPEQRQVHPLVYALGTPGAFTYYALDAADLSKKGRVVTLGSDESFVDQGANTICALVLFNEDGYDEAGTWPATDAHEFGLQALHASSWTSLGRGPVPYTCTGC